MERDGKAGLEVPESREELRNGRGRHVLMFSMCWDDWELDGARDTVREQMARY